MKSRRVFLFSTIISVCLCTVMTTPAFAVNWWQVGWIVANNVIDRVVNLDGQSSNDQYSTYMVSPSIVFNNGTNGGEFYMRPQVSSRVTSFEMHAHRANPAKGLSIKQQGQTSMSHTPDQAAMAPEHGTLVSPKMTAGKIGSVITANITAMEEVFQRSSTSQIPI